LQTGPFAGRPVPQSRPSADWQFRPRAPHLAPPIWHAGRTNALKVSEVMRQVTILETDVKSRHDGRDENSRRDPPS